VAKTLVIVESPAKARTIAAYLGDDYVVESSIGHIRDLPKRAGDVPAVHKKKPWARLGVDVNEGFRPLYVVDADKKSQITKLKKLLKDADELLLATDEDREGESIAWHLLEVLKPKVPVKRMVFHEITPRAIEHAIENPREIDRRLVDAQEARRILDRLYGYEVSPVLWKKIMPRLSAGRVQSVATRMIVERERARWIFVRASYWDVEGSFAPDGARAFDANLVQLDGKPLATGKQFDENGQLRDDKCVVVDEARARALAEASAGAKFQVSAIERKQYKRSPSAPFMTSTLQQEAGRKLRFSSSRTMKAAQRLYENGYITYMRTDSTTLSESALGAARKLIGQRYGADYLPAKPRTYKKKVKNAQEAHEAIRPAGDVFRTPAEVAGEVGLDEARVYELIWKRTLASQMQDARGLTVKVRIAGEAGGAKLGFATTGNTILFPGFLRAYVEGSDDPQAELDSRERHLPPLEEGQVLEGKTFEAHGHETQPPARFTEASLVRRLEEMGVGRPSTYASIISTILDRGYVWKKGSALVPSFKAFAVVTLLERHFGALVDYAFTARMEDDLDAIARGDEETTPWLTRFYFGKGERGSGKGLDAGLHAMVSDNLDEIDARAVNTLKLGNDDDGRDVVVRIGRYGPYLQREDQSANLPDDMPPADLDLKQAIELLEKPSGDRLLGVDPVSGKEVFLRDGRYGPYVQLGEAGEAKEKPRTSSLFSSMSIETVTFDDALKLLSLPREVGNDPQGVPIQALTGRYGPYISRGTDRRSLTAEEQVFSVTVEEALALLAQPRQRMRRQAAPPLRELGTDPVSNKPIVLREGRFGPYVTDGETNASLRRGDAADHITPERAQELLQERRERGPQTRKKKTSRRKTTKKKVAKKKTTKKKVAKKTTKKAAKKKVAKKTTKKAAKKKVAKKTTKKAAKKAGSSTSNGAKKATKSKAPKKAPADASGTAEPH
jgi:DNA topoisomerase-1